MNADACKYHNIKIFYIPPACGANHICKNSPLQCNNSMTPRSNTQMPLYFLGWGIFMNPSGRMQKPWQKCWVSHLRQGEKMWMGRICHLQAFHIMHSTPTCPSSLRKDTK